MFPKLDTTTTSVRWLTTVTGRLGYAWDRWLVYGKGGWAGGEVKVTLLDEDAAVYGADSQWANGWTVGGGAEYMIWDCTSLGVAYDYADLSIDNKTITCPALHGSGGGLRHADGRWRRQGAVGDGAPDLPSTVSVQTRSHLDDWHVPRAATHVALA